MLLSVRATVVVLMAIFNVLSFKAPPYVHKSSGAGHCIGLDGSAINCGGSIIVTVPGGRASGPAAVGKKSTATTLPAQDFLTIPSISTNAAGKPCVTFSTITFKLGFNPVLIYGARRYTKLLVSHYPLCSHRKLPAQIALSPVVLATQFWQSIPLPVPKLYIPPGYAITGKPAFLVTSGTLNPAPWTKNTPLGALQVTAKGQYYVDWGGSSVGWTGPYSRQGLPYPNGRISHTWDNVGVKRVTVRETWRARWSLGSAHGTLAQLQTMSTIHAFPVRQVQAIIVQ